MRRRSNPLVSRVIADRRVRFLIVGGGSACFEFLVFNVAYRLGAPAVGANAVSFVAVLFISFLGNRPWSFSGEHTYSGRSQFAAYLTLALINVSITSGLIHLLVSHGVRAWIAKLGCMGLVTTWNYLLLNRLIFGRVPRDQDVPTGVPPAGGTSSPSDALVWADGRR